MFCEKRNDMQENGINNVKIRRAIFSLYGMRQSIFYDCLIQNKSHHSGQTDHQNRMNFISPSKKKSSNKY